MRISIPRTGLPDGVRPERPQIIQRDRRARFRAAVAVVNGNAEVVKKFNRRGLGERAADEQRLQIAAKGLVNILQAARGSGRGAVCRA